MCFEDLIYLHTLNLETIPVWRQGRAFCHFPTTRRELHHERDGTAVRAYAGTLHSGVGYLHNKLLLLLLLQVLLLLLLFMFTPFQVGLVIFFAYHHLFLLFPSTALSVFFFLRRSFLYRAASAVPSAEDIPQSHAASRSGDQTALIIV